MEAEQVDTPHGHNETHRSKHTDRREVLDGIHLGFDECIKGHGVCQRDGRHEECYGNRVEREEGSKLHICRRISVESCGTHEETR